MSASVVNIVAVARLLSPTSSVSVVTGGGVATTQDFTTVATSATLTSGYGSNGNAAIAVDDNKWRQKASGSWVSAFSADVIATTAVSFDANTGIIFDSGAVELDISANAPGGKIVLDTDTVQLLHYTTVGLLTTSATGVLSVLGGGTSGYVVTWNGSAFVLAAAAAAPSFSRRTTAGPVTIPTTPAEQEYSSCYAGAITWNLPAVASVSAGFRVRIKDGLEQAATNNITVHPNGTDTIDGVNADFVMAMNGESYDFQSDGVGWCLV